MQTLKRLLFPLVNKEGTVQKLELCKLVCQKRGGVPMLKVISGNHELLRLIMWRDHVKVFNYLKYFQRNNRKCVPFL